MNMAANSANKKVALVTGSNKGIGFAIVKELCQKFDGDVILTSRDAKRGQEAVIKLNNLGLKPKFHLLDVLDESSIESLSQFLKKEYGGLDILVNNAAIMFPLVSIEPFGRQAKKTIETNFTALLNVCNYLFPLLRKNARVVNVSSSMGHLSKIPSDSLKNQLKKENLTVGELTNLMQQFVVSSENGNHVKDGWGTSAYAVSKVGVSALTILQQKNFEEQGKSILVNSVHPGYVATDMTKHMGPLTIEEGAVAPLFLCLENHGFKGQYIWRDCSVCNWTAQTTPALY